MIITLTTLSLICFTISVIFNSVPLAIFGTVCAIGGY